MREKRSKFISEKHESPFHLLNLKNGFIILKISFQKTMVSLITKVDVNIKSKNSLMLS